MLGDVREMEFDDAASALQTILNLYQSGQATQAERDAAQQRYDLAYAQLNATSANTKAILGTVTVLGIGYLVAKFARR